MANDTVCCFFSVACRCLAGVAQLFVIGFDNSVLWSARGVWNSVARHYNPKNRGPQLCCSCSHINSEVITPRKCEKFDPFFRDKDDAG